MSLLCLYTRWSYNSAELCQYLYWYSNIVEARREQVLICINFSFIDRVTAKKGVESNMIIKEIFALCI